ncbi:MAG: DUF819 family protein [Bacteroidales bacterium]|nr:DUF819 family protein [Bacteroidales bacterium]MBO5847208.1 DUF819 family protein [Bacteroidales bacterium]MBO7182891.1 DUF819 family protein [Bacteroidales bacterium]
MTALNSVILLIIFVLAPTGVLWLCRHVKFCGKVGPILLLYIIGFIIGNLPFINEGTMPLKDTITSVMIPLAIPMLLFACSFDFSILKGSAKVLILGLIAAIIAVVSGYFIFGIHIHEGDKVAALLMGCETGGTINMASLQQMLGVSNETYVLLNTYDMIVCFIYLIFLMSFGIKFSRKIMPFDKSKIDINTSIKVEDESTHNPYSDFFSKKWMNQLWKIMIAVVVCVVLAFLLTKAFPKGWFMPVFILGITTFAIIASFFKPIKKLDKSYDTGMYLIYIFSITVASMADLRNIHLAEELNVLGFLFFIIFGSLFLLWILGAIFKVDADLTVVASVALVNSPPFVPMIVSAQKNKSMLIPGITIGLVGFAVGNYLGFMIAQLLANF